MGIDFQLHRMKKFWRSIAQQCGFKATELLLRSKKDARLSVVCYYTPGVNNTKLMASPSSEL